MAALYRANPGRSRRGDDSGQYGRRQDYLLYRAGQRRFRVRDQILPGHTPHQAGDRFPGRLVRPGDPVELAAAVRAVSTLGEDLDGMRQAARAAYEARFTAERNLGLLLAIYERARKEVSTR